MIWYIFESKHLLGWLNFYRLGWVEFYRWFKIVDFWTSLPNHTVRNLHFLSKNSTFQFPEKIVDFFGVKKSWKCCGFGLFSCWQLWFHEKNCQKIIWWKTRINVGLCQIEYLVKNLTFRIVCALSNKSRSCCREHSGIFHFSFFSGDSFVMWWCKQGLKEGRKTKTEDGIKWPLLSQSPSHSSYHHTRCPNKF